MAIPVVTMGRGAELRSVGTNTNEMMQKHQHHREVNMLARFSGSSIVVKGSREYCVHSPRLWRYIMAERLVEDGWRQHRFSLHTAGAVGSTKGMES